MGRIPRNAIIGAALVMGLVAAFLAYSYLSKAPEQSVSAKVQVVTARTDISMGAILTPEMLRTQAVAPDALSGDAITDPQAALEKVAMMDIKSGEPITAGSLSEKSRLSQRIPKLMRAVTVAVDPIIGVGGYLEPGDRIDVAATFSSNDGTITKIILQDVQLIAIGSEVVEEKQPSAEPGVKTEPKTQTNATLAVMPSAAEKLILADSKAKLRLILRRSDDSTYTETKGITSRSLFGVVTPARAASSPLVPSLPAPLGFQRYEIKSRPPATAQEPPKTTVEIIRGTKVEQTTVDR